MESSKSLVKKYIPSKTQLVPMGWSHILSQASVGGRKQCLDWADVAQKKIAHFNLKTSQTKLTSKSILSSNSKMATSSSASFTQEFKPSPMVKKTVALTFSNFMKILSPKIQGPTKPQDSIVPPDSVTFLTVCQGDTNQSWDNSIPEEDE